MTPTPTIKTIILSDGTRLEDRGEVRKPKRGEWYRETDGRPTRATMDFCSEVCDMFSPVEAPAGNLERRGDWLATPTNADADYDDLNPLIDAACAVVNNHIANFGPDFTDEDKRNLAAALEPFTQAVKPKDRFYAVRRGDSHYVCDRNMDDGHIAKFFDEQDAKDFAAMKNSQEGE